MKKSPFKTPKSIAETQKCVSVFSFFWVVPLGQRSAKQIARHTFKKLSFRGKKLRVSLDFYTKILYNTISEYI